MSLPYGETSFYTQQESARVPFYPFWSLGDRRTKLYTLPITIHRDHYVPLELDTPYPHDPAALMVEETQPQDYGGGVIQFNRIFASAGDGYTTYGLTSYEFPGLSGGSDTPLSVTSVNVPAIGYRFPFVAPLTIDGSDVSTLVGKSYKFTLNYPSYTGVHGTVPAYTRVVRRRITPSILSGQTYYAIFSAVRYLQSFPSFVYGYATPTIASAELFYEDLPRSEVTQSKVVTSFVHTKDPDNIPVTSPIDIPVSTAIIDGQSVSGRFLTTSSTPSIDDFYAEQWVQSDRSTFTRWKGNIYRLDTPYVRVI